MTGSVFGADGRPIHIVLQINTGSGHSSIECLSRKFSKVEVDQYFSHGRNATSSVIRVLALNAKLRPRVAPNP